MRLRISGGSQLGGPTPAAEDRLCAAYATWPASSRRERKAVGRKDPEANP